MKNTKKEFRKHLLYEYVIKWNDGRTDIISNNDPPEWFRMAIIENWAIITAANPNGKQMTELENFKLNEELRIFLTLLDIKFHKVERQSIDNVRFEQDNREKVDAFLLIDVKELVAKEIALQHEQEHFVFLEMDPTLTIYMHGCGKRFDGISEPIFYFED